jgi:hypothetical protein
VPARLPCLHECSKEENPKRCNRKDEDRSRAGETGTLMRITDEGTYWIKLDQHHPVLAEWENELEIWDWSVEGAEFHPGSMLEPVS